MSGDQGSGFVWRRKRGRLNRTLGKIRIGQRVPAGAEDRVEEGSELTVAYLRVDDGDCAAVDWPASAGGRFT